MTWSMIRTQFSSHGTTGYLESPPQVQMSKSNRSLLCWILKIFRKHEFSNNTLIMCATTATVTSLQQLSVITAHKSSCNELDNPFWLSTVDFTVRKKLQRKLEKAYQHSSLLFRFHDCTLIRSAVSIMHCSLAFSILEYMNTSIKLDFISARCQSSAIQENQENQAEIKTHFSAKIKNLGKINIPKHFQAFILAHIRTTNDHFAPAKSSYNDKKNREQPKLNN